MHKVLTTVSQEINNYVKQINENYNHDYSIVTELSIQYISEKLQYVKEKFEQDTEITAKEEIFYFKNIKCHLLALMQYYSLVQKVESKKPPVKKKKIKQYYLQELFKIKKKLRRNTFFYNYYKAKATHLDNQFFRRIDHDLFFSAGEYILDIDHRSSTPTVHIFAQIEAYDQLRQYLKAKVKGFDLQQPPTIIKTPTSTLKWTASKTDLIELIYSMHASGIFNNGQAEIKEIAEFFQSTLDIDLGQYNRVFIDIRSRKTNKTKFLNTLKQKLIHRMKETDNEIFP